MVKRYELGRDYCGEYDMEEDTDGEYVKHSDYKELEAKVKELKREINLLRRRNDLWRRLTPADSIMKEPDD